MTAPTTLSPASLRRPPRRVRRAERSIAALIGLAASLALLQPLVSGSDDAPTSEPTAAVRETSRTDAVERLRRLDGLGPVTSPDAAPPNVR